ncbi:MAG: hypothetical protein V2A65_05900 [Candidatus Omnitrophota bacterium]
MERLDKNYAIAHQMGYSRLIMKKVGFSIVRSFLMLFILFIAGKVVYADPTLLSCESDKIYYQPGETVKIMVVVKNNTEQETANILRISVMWNLTDSEELKKIPISMKPGEVFRMSVSWVPKEEFWGCEAIAELLRLDSTVIRRKSETFAVHHTPFASGQQVTVFQACQKSGEENFGVNLGGFRWSTDELLKTARDYYVTWCEQSGVPPSEFSNLAPEEESWWSGWGCYQQSKGGIKKVIDESHRYGIRAFMYHAPIVTGVPGIEFARQHPEWVQRTNLGQFAGRYDQHFLEVQVPGIIDDATRNAANVGSSYMHVDVYHPAVIDFAANEIIRSTKMFNWDGIRFDGHWTLDGISYDNQVTYGYDGYMQAHGQDPDILSLRNMKQGIAIIHKFAPEFLFGYNYGFEYRNMGAQLPRTFEFCANNSAIVWESSRCMNREGDPYHTWDMALDAFQGEVDITRKAGGYEYIIPPDPGTVAFAPGFARHYLPVLYASGAHLFASAFSNEQSMLHYSGFSTEESIPIHRFAMRYSRFLYDLSIRRGLPAGCDLKVEGDGLWRSNLITTQPGINKNERIIVCHILGKRANNVININDRAEPVPVTKCKVSLVIPASMKISSVSWIAPEKDFIPIEFKSDILKQTITLPDTPYWSALIIQLRKL